ncbi:thioredoxin family protein [Steroidobacter sp. S1-65]|uniref:Thioredoxin family protein n=1 Tax=Steroidobacter gossypii TaxID=2805490 RepID=A0ABS1X3M1_9GAMM|nr:thioredoxin family protein [Steroidobacter gossypii]MBM0107797.1 thioredoxin family protein [Steroidobacter gossypii]
MAATQSTMLELGTPAPDFRLVSFDGRETSLDDFRDASGLVIAFICNHCPFVKHIRNEFARFARDYRPKGIAVIAINSNDILAYPADGPEGMAAEARSAGYTFPYLLDETQAVAKAYRAACTPDLFLFDQARKLVYRGQFDDSRPGKGEPTGADLRAACDALLSGAPVSTHQKPSIGCSIKWKASAAH